MRSPRISILPSSCLNPSSVIFMSRTGSSSGSPLGKRRCTSPMFFPTCARPARVRRSSGRKMRIPLSSCTELSSTGTTTHSPRSPARGGAIPEKLGASSCCRETTVPLAQSSSTSSA